MPARIPLRDQTAKVIGITVLTSHVPSSQSCRVNEPATAFVANIYSLTA